MLVVYRLKRVQMSLRFHRYTGWFAYRHKAMAVLPLRYNVYLQYGYNQLYSCAKETTYLCLFFSFILTSINPIISKIVQCLLFKDMSIMVKDLIVI